MWKRFVSLTIGVGLLLALFTTTLAQSEDYRLNLHRTFGYSSGSQIRGSFSMDVVGPGTLKSVTYRIDGKDMGMVDAAPFSLAFQTSQYPAGWHELSAVVETTDGKRFTTVSRRFEFATSEQEASTVTSLILPIFGGIILVLVIGMGIQFFFLRNRSGVQMPLGAQRNYGIIGGGVCPQCHRAYPLHWWAPNLGFRMKFDRCIFCGKWSIIKVLSHSELAAAESAELQMAQPAQTFSNKTEEERLKEMIEKSKYSNL
jgi:hypothetical protein